MKEFGFAWWITSIILAWMQGGFWWIVLNVFIPIAPAVKIAEILYNQ